MRLFAISLMMLFASFQVSADPIQIGNSTNQKVYVIVYFNSGSGCTPVETHTFCIDAFSAASIDVPGLRPFSARVFAASDLCIPDMSFESWKHNDANPYLVSCTAAPVEDSDPFTLAWSFEWPAGIPTWGLTIAD